MKNLLDKLKIDLETCERINESIEYFKKLDKDISERIFRFIENDLSNYFLKLLDFKKECVKQRFDEKKAKELNEMHDDIMHKGEALTDSIESKIITKQIRAFFRDLGTTLFYESEMFELGFKKPRGYPGDFQMMNYVYNNQRLSQTPFGLYMDDYFISNGYAEGVRGRKNKMRDILIDIMSNNKNPRIFNVPCGPSRDVQEALLHFNENINAEIFFIYNYF